MNLHNEFIKMSALNTKTKQLIQIYLFFIYMITMRDFCTVMSHGLQYTITIYIVNFFVYTKTLNIFGHFSIIYLRYFTASYILLHTN